MYKPNDIEILEAYDDFLLELLEIDRALNGGEIWLEAFKRGMRFNLGASQPNDSADTKSRDPFDGEYYIEYVEADVVQLRRCRYGRNLF